DVSAGLLATGGDIIITASRNILAGSSTADTNNVKGMSVAGSLRGGTILLSAGGAVLSQSGGQFNLDLSAADGQGGDLYITTLGQVNGNTESIHAGNIDLSGLNGGTATIVSADALRNPVTIASIYGSATSATGLGA